MRISKLVISVLLCGIFAFFTSCKNGGEEPEPTYSGTIKLEGVTYNISTAMIQTISDFEETNASVSLTSVSMSGKTITVQLALTFPTSEGISGIYPLETSYSDVRYLNAWMTNYMVMSGMMNFESYNDLVSGTASIADKGSNKFDISFKFKPRNGAEIEGTYSGSVIKQSMGF